MKLILGFSVPLFIGNIFQQIYSLADTMVAGYNLGDEAIAAIGATSAVSALLIDFLSGMNGGCSILVTRAFGARNPVRLRQAVAAMILLNTAVLVVLTGAVLLFLSPLMVLLNTPADIFEQAYIYIAVVCGGLFSTVFFNMFAGILRSVGNSWIPLLFQVIASVLNVVLDILLIVIFRMGIVGLALATVFAQAVSAALCGKQLLQYYRFILPGRDDWRIPRELMLEMFSMGFSMGFMLSVVQIGSIIQQSAINMLGEAAITAHTASRRIALMMVQPFLSLSTAVSVFTGQNLGAGKYERIRSALQKIITLSAGWGVISCILIFLSGDSLVKYITGTKNGQVIALADTCLRVYFFFYPILGILLCLRSALQALGQKLVPIISSGVELLLKMLAAYWLIPQIGFAGILCTEPAIWVLCTGILAVTYVIQCRERGKEDFSENN